VNSHVPVLWEGSPEGFCFSQEIRSQVLTLRNCWKFEEREYEVVGQERGHDLRKEDFKLI
jgi:hypothetical protein